MTRRRLFNDNETHENHERWLVSYADFITLLFAFFVVMYATSSLNEGKYKILSNSLVSAFKSTSSQTGTDESGKKIYDDKDAGKEKRPNQKKIKKREKTDPKKRSLDDRDRRR